MRVSSDGRRDLRQPSVLQNLRTIVRRSVCSSHQFGSNLSRTDLNNQKTYVLHSKSCVLRSQIRSSAQFFWLHCHFQILHSLIILMFWICKCTAANEIQIRVCMECDSPAPELLQTAQEDLAQDPRTITWQRQRLLRVWFEAWQQAMGRCWKQQSSHLESADARREESTGAELVP